MTSQNGWSSSLIYLAVKWFHVYIEMDSVGKRRRSRDTSNSLITDFINLRDSSLVQTGPKRPKTGGGIPLTPAPDPTPIARKKPKRTSAVSRPPSSLLSALSRPPSSLLSVVSKPPSNLLSSSRRASGRKSVDAVSDLTPRTELAQTAKDLVQAAVDRSDLIPVLSGSVPNLTPSPSPTPSPTPSPVVTPIKTPSRQSVLDPLVPETPVPETPAQSSTVLKSALKGLQTVTKDPLTGASRVSFGQFVTVNEYSPNRTTSSTGSTSSTSPDPVQAEPLNVDPLVDPIPISNSPQTDSDPQFLETISKLVSPELEPLGDDEIESEGSDTEEPILATPNLDNVKSFHSATPGTPEEEFRPVRKSRVPPPRSRATKRTNKRKQAKTLSRSLIKNLFTLASKRRVTKDAMDLIMKFSEIYLKQASHDLAVYSNHASRKTIDVNDVILLLRRQRAISGPNTFEYLVNNHLPLSYVEELIPCAQAERTIVPAIGRK